MQTPNRRKRKREGSVFANLDIEADAIKKLRESLPPERVSRVGRQLKRDSENISDMTILLTAARETIIDLASHQLMHAAYSVNNVQTEMVKLLQLQTERIERLESAIGDERADETYSDSDSGDSTSSSGGSSSTSSGSDGSSSSSSSSSSDNGTKKDHDNGAGGAGAGASVGAN